MWVLIKKIDMWTQVRHWVWLNCHLCDMYFYIKRHTLPEKGEKYYSMWLPRVQSLTNKVNKSEDLDFKLCETLEVFWISYCSLMTLICFSKLKFNICYPRMLLKDHERFDPMKHLWKSMLNWVERFERRGRSL